MKTNQTKAIEALSAHKGKTVQVATSEYLANVSSEFSPVAYIKSSTLRGLEKKGVIKIELAYWKGATITVL